jgi:hypothetical protein
LIWDALRIRGSPYGERQLRPARGAKAVESVQRVVINGQAWGESSKVVKRSKKSQKYQKLLKRGISMSRILLIWVWAAGLQGQNGKKVIKTGQKEAKNQPN